ncbi:MAG TPA: serine/threonine-protein kinase [Polyangiaceae bacterium]|jgi:serine/threonine-protein kinase
MSATELEKSLVGQVVAGKYRIDSVLGAGGMGVVLAAMHLDLGRMVAVKLMRSELTEHPWAVDRLVREAKLAAQFRGEHVCRVLDVGTVQDGAPYIVMEYLEGSDLSVLLAQNGPLEIETAVDFMLEAAEALAEAHAAHIIHRDLKPENLFVARQLDGSVSIKVLDFGISKQVGGISLGRALTNPSAALGSPFYMAPEQMRSARDVDPRADLWAVGAILFELLAGRQAFQGESLPEVCGAVMSATPPTVISLRPDVPEELSLAIARCLEKDPAARFANIFELAQAIAPYGSGNAPMSLERIERVLSRGPGTANVALSSPLLSRPSGIRLTPSGPRQRAPTPAGATTRLPSTLTPGALENQLKPRRLPWLASFAGVAVLGTVIFFMLHHASPAPAPSPTVAVLPVPEHPIAQPIGVAARAADSVEATPSSSASAPSNASADAVAAAAPHSTRGVHAAHRAPPARTVATAAAPAPTPSKKAPDVAAAWDTSSFGPRH